MQSRLTFVSVLLLTGALFLSSCDSSSNGPAPAKKCYAGKDSRFTYNRQEKDGSGRIVPGSDSTIVAVVVEGVHAFDGKDSVITVVAGIDDTTYMAYETNGDVSIYGGFDLGGFGGLPVPITDTIPKWFRLPFGAKGEVPLVSMDLDFTIDFPPISVTIKKLTGIADYKKSEDIKISSSGENLVSGKVDVVFTVSFELSGLPSALNFTTSYWYSDKIGYFTQYDVSNDEIPLGGGGFASDYFQILTAFSLK